MRHTRRKKNRLSKYNASLFLLLLTLSANAFADFRITEGFSQLKGDTLRTQAAFDLSIGQDPLDALNNGIPLTLAVEMVLFRERAWLPNEKIAQWQFLYEINYHALSGRYVVSEQDSDEYTSFSTVNAALQAVGQFSNNWDTSGSVTPNDDQEYFVKLRVRLDLTPLPAPIKLISHVARQWRQNSGWEQWSVLR